MTSGLTRREFLTAASGAVAAGALAQGASAQSGGSWLSLGNDPANTGLTDGNGPTGDVGRAWATGTDGAVFGGPAVVDDLVIAGSEDSVVYGIDAGSGDVRWTFEAEGIVDTTPAIAGDTVYVGDREGFLYALDIAGGDDQEQWRFETQGEVNSPAVFDGTVYVSSRNGALHAVDAEEGRSVDPDAWPVPIGRGASGVESSPAVATAEESGRDEPTIVVGSGDGRVYAVTSDGSTAWTTTVDNAQSIPTSPAVADGTVYVGSLAGGQSGYLHALDGASGDQLWEFDTGGPVYGSPAIVDGTAFVGSRAGTLFAVDSSNGTKEWEYDAGRQIRSAPAVTDDAVYIGSLSSEVVGVDRVSGDELWTFETNQRVTSHPAVTDGAVFIGGQDTYVYRLETGAEGTAPDPTPENTGPVPGPLERDRPGDLTFLALPAAAGGFLALVAGGAYAAKRAGVLQRFGVDEAPIEEIYEDDEHIPDYDAPPSTDVWELVVGDVITRAEETDKVATKNLIVSRHLDADTLDSPVVAYEIESARSGPAGVRIEEPLIDPEETADEMAEQPLNEGWSVSDESLVYERAIEAGETVKTMVGRVDCPTERADELRTSPEIEIGTDDE
jgi:outer membrane protein assembly factor BamB